MSEWQPIETAPYQKVIEVKNDVMPAPVRATRGYYFDGMVHADNTFCTSVYTPNDFFPMRAGALVCAKVWRPVKSGQKDA